MFFNAFIANAILASVAAAAPAVTYPGPPVVYKTSNNAPAVTATTLADPAATPHSKRDNNVCIQQPAGISHGAGQSDTTFLQDPYYAQQAQAAQTPQGFNAIFTNTQASPNAPGYLGYTLLKSYDVQSCANQCNAIKGCSSFNVYFERDPSVQPGPSCPNPPSVTNIKCVWWSSQITTAQNVNNGQYAEQFHVVIAGSNGYVGGPYQRGVTLKVQGTGTFLDGRPLYVSPGEGAAVALQPVDTGNPISTFQLASDGKLLELTPYSGLAAVPARLDGQWAPIQYRAVGQSNVDYFNCMTAGGAGLITCRYNGIGALVFGVCPAKANRNSYLLYSGAGQDQYIPEGCFRAGVYMYPVQG